ncbi:hypothetical protein PR048_000948, partial [Dryococelus australis]
MNENRKAIEENTRGQSSYRERKEQRCKRITASFFGKICKMKPTTSCASKIKKIRYNVFKGNLNSSWDLEKEGEARSQYAEENNISVHACGLLEDEEFPYLGASPDGLIRDDAVLEVKFIYVHIQGFLHIPKREYCYFVWSSTGMIHENFYFNCLSEIIDSRHARKLAIREPKFFYKAQESH